MDPLLPLVDHALRALAVSHGGVSLRRDERKGGRGGGKEGKEEGGWGKMREPSIIYTPKAARSRPQQGTHFCTKRDKRHPNMVSLLPTAVGIFPKWANCALGGSGGCQVHLF